MGKNLLFITYVFPPVGGAGIQRNIKFIKYLTLNSWDVTVLAPANPSVPVVDNSFIDDIPTGIEVVRTKTFEPSYNIKSYIQSNEVSSGKRNYYYSIKSFIFKLLRSIFQSIVLPDVQILWVIPSLIEAVAIIKRKNIKIIYASGPPFSILLFGSILSRFSKIPFVSDFRDEWTDFYEKQYHSHGKLFGKTIISKMEKYVVTNARAITMATEAFVTNIVEKYPDIKNKTISITNGYDPGDFENVKKSIGDKNKEIFNIYYIGTVFNVTTPRYFLEACVRLLKSKPELGRNIVVNFVGRITEEENMNINSYKDHINIIIHGYVEHNKIVPLIMNADLLLTIVDSLNGGERIISAKIFEYAYSGNIMLALVPVPGEISEFVNKARCGVCCSPRDIDRIADILGSLVRNGKHTEY